MVHGTSVAEATGKQGWGGREDWFKARVRDIVNEGEKEGRSKEERWEMGGLIGSTVLGIGRQRMRDEKHINLALFMPSRFYIIQNTEQQNQFRFMYCLLAICWIVAASQWSALPKWVGLSQVRVTSHAQFMENREVDLELLLQEGIKGLSPSLYD